MLYFSILFLTAFGLGEFFCLSSLDSKQEKMNSNQTGLAFYLGFISIPIFLFFSNLIFKLPLTLGSQVLFGLSLLGVIKFFIGLKSFSFIFIFLLRYS